MRRVEITREQLRLLESIMDADKPTVSVTGPDKASLAKNAKKEFDKAKKNIPGENFKVSGTLDTNNADDETEVKLKPDSNDTNNVEQSVNKALNSYKGDPNKVSIEFNSEDFMNECVLTKGQIERYMLAEMRRTGKITTKGDMVKEARKRTFKL